MKKSGMKLAAAIISRYTLSLLFTCITLFIPAGTISYMRGWLCISLLFTPMLFTLLYLLIKDPALLEKRIRTGERERGQRICMRISLPFTFAAFIIPGLDYRFGWSLVPLPATITAAAIMAAGYALFVSVLMVNRFASRIIEIQENQVVVDRGPYAVIRHPMYLAVLIIYGSSPFVLGSYYALMPLAALPFIIIFRIRNEEEILAEGLPGYEEYMKRVRYRLVPFVW